MKYTEVIDVALPRDEVIALFDNPDNMKHWQPELISFEHMSGEPGTIGAKSKLMYAMGKREMEMIETIVARDLPDRFSATYEAGGVWNQVDNSFVGNGDVTTWTIDTEFRAKGMMKIMAMLMPGMFRKQTRKFMTQFKEFAESSKS